MGLGKFKKGAKKVAKKKAVSKYSGVTPAEDRDPILEEGLHKVRVLGTEEFEGEKKGGQYFKATLEIVESSVYEPGSVYCFLQCVTKGNALRVGGPKVLSFVQAAAGFDDFEAFCEDKGGSDEAALFVDACGGEEDACEQFGENPLEGRILNVRAQKNGEPKTYTNDKGEETTTQYYNYQWAAEEDQDA